METIKISRRNPLHLRRIDWRDDIADIVIGIHKGKRVRVVIWTDKPLR